MASNPQPTPWQHRRSVRRPNPTLHRVGRGVPTRRELRDGIESATDTVAASAVGPEAQPYP
ncbi:MAG: hypothetical protein ACC742_15775, partial [Thermoanaerobaculales bacterium]